MGWYIEVNSHVASNITFAEATGARVIIPWAGLILSGITVNGGVLIRPFGGNPIAFG